MGMRVWLVNVCEDCEHVPRSSDRAGRRGRDDQSEARRSRSRSGPPHAARERPMESAAGFRSDENEGLAFVFHE